MSELVDHLLSGGDKGKGKSLVDSLLAPHAKPKGAVLGGLGQPTIDTRPAAMGVLKAVAGTVPAGADLVNRADEANLARHAGRSFFGTLAHGESPEQFASDTSLATRQLMGASPEQYAKLGGTRRFANELSTQALYDPLTYLSADVSGVGRILGGAAERALAGRTLAGAALREGEKHVLPAIVNGSSKVAQAAAKLHPALGEAANSVADHAAEAHDFFGIGNSLKRDLARRYGPEWLNVFEKIHSSTAGAQGKGALGAQAFDRVARDAFKGLSPADQTRAIRAVNKGDLTKLSPEARAAAEKYQEVTRSLAHLKGTRGARAKVEGFVGAEEKPDIFRFQRTAGGPEQSARGGTFFSRSAPDASFRTPEDKHLLGRVASPKNPLDVSGETLGYQPGLGALQRLRAGKPTASNLFFLGGEKNARRYLRAVGVRDDEIEKVLSLSRESVAWNIPVADRVAAELARRKGYDAILSPNEFFALKPSAYRAPRAGTPFSLPEYAAPFDIGPRNLMVPRQTRVNYVTAPHTEGPPRPNVITAPGFPGAMAAQSSRNMKLLGVKNSPEAEALGLFDLPSQGMRVSNASLMRRAKGPLQIKRNPADAKDPYLKSRGNIGVVNDPELYMNALEKRIRSAFDTMAAQDVRHAVKQIVGRKDAPAIIAQLTQTLPARPTSKIVNAGKAFTDLSKASLFFNPTRHGANISSLALLKDPKALVQGLANTPRLMRMGPAERVKELLPAAQAGAIGRNIEAVNKAPLIGGLRPVQRAYAGSQNALWSFDTAVKKAAFDNLVKRGMSPATAAREVGSGLIDYGERSPFADYLSNRGIAPFATYRTKMPFAVLRSTAQAPGRASALTRALPFLGGAQVNAKNGRGDKAYLPSAEVARALNGQGEHAAFQGLGDYAKSSLSPFTRALLDPAFNYVINGATPNDPYDRSRFQNQATYGQRPDVYLAQQSPYASYLQLFKNGIKGFPEQLLRQSTGFYSSKVPSPPSKTSMYEDLLPGMPPWEIYRLLSHRHR